MIVSKFAKEKVQPLVRKMDKESEMDKSVIKGLFDNGVSKKNAGNQGSFKDTLAFS